MSAPHSIPVTAARCLSCAGETISCIVGERFNRFMCERCGEVVISGSGFVRPAEYNRFALAHDGVKCFRAVAGCLTCGCDVQYPVMVEGETPQCMSDGGICVNCGRVERVTPENGSPLRFCRAPGWPSLQLRGIAERSP